MEKIVTKDSMIKVINEREIQFLSKYVGRALLAIFNRQTKYEKLNNCTQAHNNIGFSGTDAYSGSLCAKYFRKHNRLEEWMIRKWIRNERNSPRITKYWKQLNEIANEKRNIL